MFSRGGFDAKAVAIYKQILRVERGPPRGAHRTSASTSSAWGSSSDALREFQEAFKICQKKELKREAFELLRRVASLDPSNVANRLNLADLFAREGMLDDARDEYTSLLEEVRRQTGVDLVLRVAEQMLRRVPRQPRGARRAGLVEGATGEHAEAVKLLKRGAAATSRGHRAARDARHRARGRRRRERRAQGLARDRGALQDARRRREVARDPAAPRRGRVVRRRRRDHHAEPPAHRSDRGRRRTTLADDGDDIDLELDEPAAPKTAPQATRHRREGRAGVARPPIVEARRAPEPRPSRRPPARRRRSCSPRRASRSSSAIRGSASASRSSCSSRPRLARRAQDPDDPGRRASPRPKSRGRRRVEIDEPAPARPEVEEERARDRAHRARRAARSPSSARPRRCASPSSRRSVPTRTSTASPTSRSCSRTRRTRTTSSPRSSRRPGCTTRRRRGPSRRRSPRSRRRRRRSRRPCRRSPRPGGRRRRVRHRGRDRRRQRRSRPDLEQAPRSEERRGESDLGPDGDESLEFSEPLASESKEAAASRQSSARIEETLSEADFYLEQGLYDEAERIYQSVLVIVPQPSEGDAAARRARGPARQGPGEEAAHPPSSPTRSATRWCASPTATRALDRSRDPEARRSPEEAAKRRAGREIGEARPPPSR